MMKSVPRLYSVRQLRCALLAVWMTCAWLLPAHAQTTLNAGGGKVTATAGGKVTGSVTD